MSRGVLFRILGIEDLQASIQDTARQLLEAEQASAMAAGEPIKEAWVSMVPIEDGHYRDSLTVAWLGRKGAAVGTAWLTGVPTDEQPFLYAKRLEFGMWGTRAQPSAKPAMVASKQAALEAGGRPFRSIVSKRKARKPKGA